MSMTPSQRRLDAYRLKHAAEEGRAIVYTCHACKQETTFLAADVVDIWGPEMKPYDPPRACGKCKANGQISVRIIWVTEYDRGKLLLRRPAGVRRTQLWKWARY